MQEEALSFWTRNRIFQKAATAIFLAFMGLMIGVTIIAFSRKSGKTGLNMGKVQKMHYEASKQSEEE